MVVVNGKTVPGNSADSWVSKIKGIQTLCGCAEKIGINVGMIIVLDSAAKTGGMCRCPHYVS